MTIARRRLLGALALGAAPPQGGLSLDVLRDVSVMHGTSLGDDRLRIIQPALQRRFADLSTLRAFDLDESVAPIQGILDE